MRIFALLQQNNYYMSKDKEVINNSNLLLPNDYSLWRKGIETLIDTAKLKAAINVNMELLSLYWNIGKQILDKQEKQGWGKKIIEQLSKDLIRNIPMIGAILSAT